MFKVINGRWKKVSEEDRELDPFELQAISKKSENKLKDFFQGFKKITSDKINIAINLSETSEQQDKVISKILELNPKQLKELEKYIIPTIIKKIN